MSVIITAAKSLYENGVICFLISFAILRPGRKNEKVLESVIFIYAKYVSKTADMYLMIKFYRYIISFL